MFGKWTQYTKPKKEIKYQNSIFYRLIDRAIAARIPKVEGGRANISRIVPLDTRSCYAHACSKSEFTNMR